jgi:hypothetical protein
MSGLLLARTSPSDLQPLSAAGTAVRDHFPQLRALLAARFGASYEHLLAEPSFDGPASPVDWYGPEGRIAEKLMSLPAQRRWEVAQRARTMLSEVRAESDRLRASADPAARVLGDQLDKLLRIPSLDYVYVVDDRPVIVAWAHAALGRSSDIVELLGLIEGGPPPPPPPSAVAPGATLRPSFLVLAALVVLFALATYGLLRIANQTDWFGYGPNILASTEAATRDAIAKIRRRLAEKCRPAGGHAAGATPPPNPDAPRAPTNAAPSPPSPPKLADSPQPPAPDGKSPDQPPVAPNGADKATAASDAPAPPTDPDKTPTPPTNAAPSQPAPPKLADSTQPPAPDGKAADETPVAPSGADKTAPAPDAPTPPTDANKPPTPPTDVAPSLPSPPKAADSTQTPAPDAKTADQTPAPAGADKPTPAPEAPGPPADSAKPAIPATPGKPLDDQKLTNRDPTIFKGCWSRTSQMQIEDVQKNITFPVKTWETCMDEKGDGEQKIVFANGDSCKGRVHARFLPDGRVEITDVEPCKGVNGPDKTVYTCARADERSLKCSWEQPASGRKGADVALRPE